MYRLKDEQSQQQQQVGREVGIDLMAVISGVVQFGAGLVTIALGYQQLTKRRRH